MKRNVIEIAGLSKVYQLGQFGTGSISRDMERYWARLRGKEDPFLKIGETNDRAQKSKSGVIWSLKDINLNIEQGDALGIIGRNGAGKSTLLKILSRVTAPTTGTIKVKGRIASLLEVGTGFHPELSGRENVYLNGAILGMRKKEISRRFSEIVEFSGVERYIDTPVKRYSSGMYVRLAFAVAAHLESEILIVDEVLAVGDAEFQRKCLGKIGEISSGDGRTVLFVSHNMQAIQKLCTKSLLLKNGMVQQFDDTHSVIDSYLREQTVTDAVVHFPIPEDMHDRTGYATRLQIENASGEIAKEIATGQQWQIRVLFTIIKKAEHFIIGLGLNTLTDIGIRTSWSKARCLEPGTYEAVFKEENLIFTPGSYSLTVGLSNYERAIHYIENAATFVVSDVVSPLLDKTIVKVSTTGLILNPMDVHISHVPTK